VTYRVIPGSPHRPWIPADVVRIEGQAGSGESGGVGAGGRSGGIVLWAARIMTSLLCASSANIPLDGMEGIIPATCPANFTKIGVGLMLSMTADATDIVTVWCDERA